MLIYDIYGKVAFQIKIIVTLLMFLVLFLLPNAHSQGYTQLNLPEGAIARLGKGDIATIQYSPDGTQLAVAGSIGIWLSRDCPACWAYRDGFKRSVQSG